MTDLFVTGGGPAQAAVVLAFLVGLVAMILGNQSMLMAAVLLFLSGVVLGNADAIREAMLPGAPAVGVTAATSMPTDEITWPMVFVGAAVLIISFGFGIYALAKEAAGEEDDLPKPQPELVATAVATAQPVKPSTKPGCAYCGTDPCACGASGSPWSKRSIRL